MSRKDGVRVSHDDVIMAYRFILGREPESEHIIERHQREADSFEHLRMRLIASREFRSKYPADPTEEDRWVLAEIKNDLRLWINLRDSGVSRLCVDGNYEPAETKFILSTIEAGDVFVDMGANIGWFTNLVAEKVGPAGRVIAFEPRGVIFHQLSRSVAENRFNDRVTLHRLALGSEAGEMELVWSKTGGNYGGARLAPEGLGVYDGHEKVRIATLDSLSLPDSIALIKMDIEGAEPMALKGARSTLIRSRPTILCEIGKSMMENVSKVSAGEFLIEMKTLGYSAWLLSASGEKDRRVKDIDDLVSEITNVIFEYTG